MKGFTLYELVLAILIGSLVATAGFNATISYRQSHIVLTQTIKQLMEVELLKATLQRYLLSAWQVRFDRLQPSLRLINHDTGLTLTGLAPGRLQVVSWSSSRRLTVQDLQPRFKTSDHLILLNHTQFDQAEVQRNSISYRYQTQQLSLVMAIKLLSNAVVTRWQHESFYWDKTSQTIYQRDYRNRRYRLIPNVKQLLLQRLTNPPGLLASVQFNSGQPFKFFIPLVRQWHE